jgi:hypothetical protein
VSRNMLNWQLKKCPRSPIVELVAEPQHTDELTSGTFVQQEEHKRREENGKNCFFTRGQLEILEKVDPC